MVVALYNTAGLSFFLGSRMIIGPWFIPIAQGGSPSKVFNSLRCMSNDKNSNTTSNIKITTENVTKYVVLTHLRHKGKFYF